MKLIYTTIAFLILAGACFAQSPRPSLEEISKEINKDLPQVYDPVTKLMRTTVENNSLKYHFLLDADQKEYSWAMPKVRTQVLSTICSKPREKTVLKNYRVNILYSYENVKGQSLGEFMVKPEQCH